MEEHSKAPSITNTRRQHEVNKIVEESIFGKTHYIKHVMHSAVHDMHTMHSAMHIMQYQSIDAAYIDVAEAAKNSTVSGGRVVYS